MRGRMLAVVAGMALAMGTWSGVALAAEQLGSGSWSWYYEGAIEAGNLPNAELPAGVSIIESRQTPAPEVPVVTVGGLVYRLGIDTQ